MNAPVTACTIVSMNYIPYARVLSDSFFRFHPEGRFVVLVADRKSGAASVSEETFEVVYIEDLKLPDFPSVAFKYNILELNTAIKPSFLKHLIEAGAERLVYLDPDIRIYKPLDEILAALEIGEIVLTPHITRPLPPEICSREQIFLLSGIFNLGFLGLRRGETAFRLLDWWEKHCLDLGYLDLETGLFVDQKWIGLAPCLFDPVHILKHPGCNMAHWNLPERTLSRDPRGWMVNGTSPLIFFHFSGIDPFEADQISKYQDGYNLGNREDLRELFSEYRSELRQAGIQGFRHIPYSFGKYSNGEAISPLARRIFSLVRETFPNGDPFDAEGPFYSWAKRNGLLKRRGELSSEIPLPEKQRTSKARSLGRFFRIALSILGPERYLRLMKYLSYISNPRHQAGLFKT